MMKKYMKPSMESELFKTNEFVAACYKIHCFTPNNNNDGVWDNEDKLLYSSPKGGFTGCKNGIKELLFKMKL